MRKSQALMNAAILFAIGAFALGQDGPGPDPGPGSGSPAGSTYATQYKASAGIFGGTGPGTSGQVLTSNGSGSPPSYQAAPSSPPGGSSGQVQFNDAGTFGGDAGLTYTAASDVLGAITIQPASGNDITLRSTANSGAVTISESGTSGGVILAASGSGGALTMNAEGSTAEITITAGQTLTGGLLLTTASATGTAGFRLPAGTAPTSPTNGDMWTTSSGLFVRINGATVGPLAAAGATQTTGTFQTTWPNSCTTTSTQNWRYVKTGTEITIQPTDQVDCTSDSTTFNTSGGTGLPSLAFPATATCLKADAANSGASVAAVLQITTSGALFLANSNTNCDATGWTNSGNKLFPSTANSFPTFTYQTAS